MYITYDVYKSIADGLEIRSVFLDISVAFDKVWHESLFYKLEQNGILCDAVKLVTDFLYQGKQKFVLGGIHSSWTNAETGFPQVSILGPLFFLIYIDDLSDGLTTIPNLFADYAFLFSIVHDVNLST